MLDRASAFMSWWAKFPFCNLKIIQTPCSDHDLMLLELFQLELSRKKFRFRFENIWLKEPGFIAEVFRDLDKYFSNEFVTQIDGGLFFYGEVGRSFFHKFREKIKEQKSILERLNDLTDDISIQTYISAKENLNNLLYQEESFLEIEG